IKCSHVFDYLVELSVRQLRVDRQRENFTGRALGLRTASSFVTEVREAGLQVERQRIIDRAADPLLLEETLKLVTPRNAQRVLIENRLVGGINRRQRHAVDTLQSSGVICRIRAALGAPLSEMRELRAEHCGL